MQQPCSGRPAWELKLPNGAYRVTALHDVNVHEEKSSTNINLCTVEHTAMRRPDWLSTGTDRKAFISDVS